MRLLWLAALCAALGIGCLLTPWHIAMTGVCLLLLAGVMAACCLLRGERGKRWRRVLWSLAALGMAAVFGMMGFIALDGRDDAPEEDVVVALEAIQDPVSLFEPVYMTGGDAICVMDQIRDDGVSEDQWVRDLSIKGALSKLKSREKTIICRRFFQGKTQMEVADEIGISQAQVSRLEKAALAQMRKYV